MKRSSPEIIPPAKEIMSEKAEASFFLDSIPKEILENVLRYFSSIPNATKWERFIDVRNLVKALGFGGEFRTLLKSRFRTIYVSRTNHFEFHEALSGWQERTEPYLWTDDISVAHAFVVAGGGEYLRTLVIDRDMYKRERDGDNLVDDFVTYCPNMTSLSIEEEWDAVWTKKFGSQLEILEVHADMVLADKFVLRLEKLRPEDNFPLNLYQRGPALRELNMTAHRESDGGFDKIKLHCPNLKSVSVRIRPDLGCSAITKLLVSYGDRLEYALLFWLSEDQIRAVADACPNARFHVTGNYQFGLTLTTLKLIGPRVEGVDLYFANSGNMHIDMDECTDAWSQCMNLRYLYTHPTKAEDLEAVFSTPKNHLVSAILLLLDFVPRDVKKLMDSIANGTKCVEKIEFYLSPCSIYELNGFIGKNSATLRCISLRGNFSAGNKKLDELLTSFLQLPALEELFVDYEIPQDILTSLHNNGVYFCRE